MDNLVIYGGCGSVRVDPRDKRFVIKTFCVPKNPPSPRDYNYLIQEVILTKYFCDTSYVVKYKSFSMKTRSMSTQRWPYSLEDAIRKFQKTWTIEDKHMIFRDIIYGMCNLQLRGIIHADIKTNNILYNPRNHRACLCDLGLSSIVKYAKVSATCKEIKPSSDTVSSKGRKVIGCDMFALCILAMKLFMGINHISGKSFTPLELRNKINNSNVIIDSHLKSVILSMVPDDISTSPTAMDILDRLYGETMQYDVPQLKFNENTRVDRSDVKFIHDTIIALSNKYKIQRGNRCCNALISYLNRPNKPVINPVNYDAFIAAAVLIYSSLFSDPYFHIEHAFSLISSGVSRNVFECIVTDMVEDNDFCEQTLYPSYSR